LLANGLKLIVAENDDLPTISIAFANPLARTAHRKADALLGELTLETLLETAMPAMERDEGAVVFLSSRVEPRGTTLMFSGLGDTLRQMGEHLRLALLPVSLDAVAVERAKDMLGASVTAAADERSVRRFAADVLYGSDDDDLKVERAEQKLPTLVSITIEQLDDYYRARYAPASSALVFSGPVTLDEATTVAQRELGDWSGAPRKRAHPTPRMPTPGRRLRRFTLPSSQADHLIVAMPCPDATSQDYLAFELLTRLLEQVPTFELARALRYETAMAYAWRASCVDTTCERTFFVQIETGPGQAVSALEALLGVFEHLADSQLTQAELATARASFLSERAGQLSSSRDTAAALADAFLHDLPDDFYETPEDRVKKLTPPDLEHVARRWLRDAPMAIVVEGQYLPLRGHPLLSNIAERD
jgi:zinc protease